MTPEIAMKVGMAAGAYFTSQDREHTHRVVIAKDTRLSSYMIENALTAGFLSVGINVELVGPLPTPAVAMLARSMRADIGVMISASHNAFEDNGIKLFGPDGFKLSDDVEAAIAAMVLNEEGMALAHPKKLGRAKRIDDAQGRYIEFVKRRFPDGLRLDGLKIVLDCANGAGYKVAPTVLWELGAEVITIGAEPNGFNINKECGSTHMGRLCARVVAEGADMGIALDGDADRLVMCDEKGEVIDGDQLMALIARDWKHRGELKGDGVVSTIMSNLGLEKALAEDGLKLHRTQVGDRYVMQKMLSGEWNIGGEPSGHIIIGGHATTGDGLLAALQVLAAYVEDGRAMSDVGAQFTPVPQLMKNVRFERGISGDALLASESVQAEIMACEGELGASGRIITRKSGTEPLIRVMVEGDDEAQIEAMVDRICAVIEAAASKVAA
jgi:phosphoglucosamine mutase